MSTGYDGGVNTIGMSKKKSWVRSKKIVVDIGKCKYCSQEMTNEDSFVPIGKVINGRYIYKFTHYDCLKKATISDRL